MTCCIGQLRALSSGRCCSVPTRARTAGRQARAMLRVRRQPTSRRSGSTHFSKGAAIVGGQGGDGVLLVRHDAHWSNPAFYHIGGGSIGVQIGGASGSMALLLMSDKAVKPFTEHASKGSLDSSAGLSVVNYSTEAAAEMGNHDVVVWSDTKGLFGGAAVGVRNVSRDEDADRAYYEQPDVTSEAILSGRVRNPRESNARLLRHVLPMRLASK
jgi:SH3 domain-containing YSC84-like protein 1